MADCWVVRSVDWRADRTVVMMVVQKVACLVVTKAGWSELRRAATKAETRAVQRASR